MKCPKCGFVSFDYLSECKKCDADLKAVRDSLKMPGIKPQTRSFLEGLLMDSVSAKAPMGVGSPPAEEPEEPFFPDVELGESEFELEPVKFAPAVEARVGRAASADSSPDQRLPEINAAGEDADIDLVLQMQDDDSDQAFRMEGDSGIESHRDFDVPTLREAVVIEEPDSPEYTEESLVIDLSESDLENLLLELEEVPLAQEKEGQFAAPDSSKKG